MKGRLTPDSWLINKPIAHRGWYDEFSPENLTLSFSASNKYTLQIKIIAFVQASQNEIVKTEKLILINGQN